MENNNIIPISERAKQPSQCSEQGTISRSDLQPATASAGTAQLMACLTLVAPSGMTAEDRTAWVAVARQTLSGIPGDLLEFGCKRARETCRFPSEIVPAILDEVKPIWRQRKRLADEAAVREANKNAPKLPPPDYVTPEEAKAIVAEAIANLRGDAS